MYNISRYLYYIMRTHKDMLKAFVHFDGPTQWFPVTVYTACSASSEQKRRIAAVLFFVQFHLVHT